MALWVFGYGSLLWDPGFEFESLVQARLCGFHRSFCMRSIHHRGSLDDPGLVLALDQQSDGICDGVAFEVSADNSDNVLGYLRERELISSAYDEVTVPIELIDGRTVRAVTFIINREHVQYCADMALEEQAQIIASAIGGRGPNAEYLFNTVAHLKTLGIADDDLDWLDHRVNELSKDAT